MKRSCAKCRALHDQKCELGYEITKYQINAILCGYKPLEDCPKPKTWDEFDAAISASKGNNTSEAKNGMRNGDIF